MTITDEEMQACIDRARATIARIAADRAARPLHVDPDCAYCGEPVLSWQSGRVDIRRDSDGRVFAAWGYHQRCLTRKAKGG